MPPTLPVLLGRLIVERRTALNLSQRRLGYLVDVDTQVISSWETGRRLPTLPNFLALAHHLGLDLGDLSVLLQDGDNGGAAAA